LIIFQQLQKEGRNPLFMLRYAGKSRSNETERDREKGSKEDDPTTPKLNIISNGDVGKSPAANGMI